MVLDSNSFTQAGTRLNGRIVPFNVRRQPAPCIGHKCQCTEIMEALRFFLHDSSLRLSDSVGKLKN